MTSPGIRRRRGLTLVEGLVESGREVYQNGHTPYFALARYKPVLVDQVSQRLSDVGYRGPQTLGHFFRRKDARQSGRRPDLLQPDDIGIQFQPHFSQAFKILPLARP